MKRAVKIPLRRLRRDPNFRRYVRNPGPAPSASLTPRKQRYREYLLSDHWTQFRLLILARRGRWCEDCGSTDRLDVHHLTYERVGAERESDVQVLCRSCHEKRHRKSPADLNGQNGRRVAESTAGIAGLRQADERRAQPRKG